MNPLRKTITSIAALLLLTTSLFSQEIGGTWQGVLKVQGVELEILFHIEKHDSEYISLMDSPTQGAFDISTTKTTFKNEQVEIVVANLGAFYQGKLDNDTIKGTFNQGGIPFPLVLSKTIKKKPLRPQEPKAPYPYDVEETTFINTKEKIKLAATLTLPKQKKKSPAVILIAGSGPNDRDETIFAHKPFWILADYLTRQGIAVLRYDKRGVGESEGEYFTATTKDFAEDVGAAISYLKTREEIDTTNIGLIGHSEGGIIAPMVAAGSNDVKFIVLMAGLGVTGTELVLAQHQREFDKQSPTDEEKENLNKALINLYSNILNWTEYAGNDKERSQLKEDLGVLWQSISRDTQATMQKDLFIKQTTSKIISPWFRYFLGINPLEHIEKIRIPVLAINGENDTQVDYQSNLEGIEKALKKGSNKQYTIKSYPHMNHLFQESTTGEIEEYGKIEETFSPIVLSDIANWIKLQVE
ncbi:MAG: alpha/beta hydrolase [Bacteroidales bacterium]|nr:alpha/beta hydrolase [Bacteroidales bacterium]